MGTANRLVIKPRSGTAIKNGTGPIIDDNALVLDVPMDFTGNIGGNGQNIPYYHVDVSQTENFGYIQGIKVDTRNMNTDLTICINGMQAGQQTNSAPNEGIEFLTVEPGVIATFSITSTQASQVDFFVANSDPNSSASTYGTCVAYLYNIDMPHHQTPSKNCAGLIPPASKGINIGASGTTDIVDWTGKPSTMPRIFQGARLCRPAAVAAAAAGGIKVAIIAEVNTPVTGLQDFPLITLFNTIPAAAGNSQIDQDYLGGSLGIYLPKTTVKLRAVATLDVALTAGQFYLECLIQDSTNDLAPLN